MRIPFSWLSEFVELGEYEAEDIAEILSLKSVEASVDTFGIELDGVVFGKVESIKKHSIRRELSVVNVDVGSGRKSTVVTSDGNISGGDVVIVALPGAQIGDRKVGKRDFAGVVSEGMLLSAQELGLEEASEGVLKFVDNIEPGTQAGPLLGFGEKVIELDITPNRGDVLSVKGLARELSALLGVKKKKREVRRWEESGELSIEIEDEDCHRYRGAVIKNVKVSLSPLYIRKRLWQSGLKSINNIVDVTNYILLQEGQPLHAFDLDKLSGGVVVRSAREGESIVTLDGEERKLSPEVLVIADREVPAAVAGVIGGKESAVTPSTENILLESAYFHPSRVRRSSKLLGIQTESSYRFERNVDIEGLREAQDLAVELILGTAGGKVEAVRDKYVKRYEPKKVFLSMGKFMRYAGESYKNEEASAILHALEIPHEIKRCGIEVLVPAHRSFDINRDVDIVEELMRVKGYDHYSSEPLKLPTKGKLWKDRLLELRKFLRDRGLSEIITLSYEDKDLYELLGLEPPQVEILNPLIPSQRYMRSSLLPSLLRSAKFNESHYNYDVALFEVGKVFLKDSEQDRLGIVLKGSRTLYPHRKWEAHDLIDLIMSLARIFGKELMLEASDLSFLHPHAQSRVLKGNKSIGFIGKLHPAVVDRLELKGELWVCELAVQPLLEDTHIRHKPLSKFPPVIRDLALLVDKSMSVSKLLNEIKSQLGDVLEEAAVFDIYADVKVGEGKKSVGVRLTFRSMEKSLSGEEVNRLVEDLVRRLREHSGVEMR